jgi:hypothetical protein
MTARARKVAAPAAAPAPKAPHVLVLANQREDDPGTRERVVAALADVLSGRVG